ncbi:hypothetical protein SKAU_G00388620 [Synaphobranchus kaupii]|uniref:Uncharacterized protein n=1 Tax=Synaphobranchus kaupii TaxID=118154 RepID=A0A9Q1ICJ8_SYNKA|nr:hypothetical protein SKAU_G00388620 [Synaphobranchus kaupii]
MGNRAIAQGPTTSKGPMEGSEGINKISGYRFINLPAGAIALAAKLSSTYATDLDSSLADELIQFKHFVQSRTAWVSHVGEPEPAGSDRLGRRPHPGNADGGEMARAIEVCPAKRRRISPLTPGRNGRFDSMSPANLPSSRSAELLSGGGGGGCDERGGPQETHCPQTVGVIYYTSS